MLVCGEEHIIEESRQAAKFIKYSLYYLNRFQLIMRIIMPEHKEFRALIERGQCGYWEQREVES